MSFTTYNVLHSSLTMKCLSRSLSVCMSHGILSLVRPSVRIEIRRNNFTSLVLAALVICSFVRFCVKPTFNSFHFCFSSSPVCSLVRWWLSVHAQPHANEDRATTTKNRKRRISFSKRRAKEVNKTRHTQTYFKVTLCPRIFISAFTGGPINS